MNQKVLSQILRQYQRRHGKPPEKIIIHPAAMVALTLRKSIGPVWEGVPVECRAIKPQGRPEKPTMLGISIYKDAIQGYDM